MDDYGFIKFPDDEPKKNKFEYVFDLNLRGENIWKLKDESQKNSETLIKESFSFIMEQIREEKVKNFRND